MLKRTQKITPFLWFNQNAEEAVKFYTTVFSSGPRNGRNSTIGTTTKYGEAGSKASGRPKGTVMTIDFELEGQRFTAINGGPEFKFTHAISFVVQCENQEEIDYFWEKLSSDGGSTEPCGWLQDKYGVSWQIVPASLDDLMKNNAERSEAVMAELMKMSKIDIATLERAYDGAKKKSTATV